MIKNMIKIKKRKYKIKLNKRIKTFNKAHFNYYKKLKTINLIEFIFFVNYIL